MIDWRNANDTNGHPTREFRISRDGKRDITGALWLPDLVSAANTLMCFGHGASGNRYQRPICALARRFVTEAGIAALSLDGPVHGLRQVGEGGRTAFWPELQREDTLRNMTEDWFIAIDAVQALDEVGKGRLAYFGLSMGSIYGIPLIAARDDVTVATLGLFGTRKDSLHHDAFIDALGKISCPLLFLMQLEDELFTRESCLEAFDNFASEDKRLHANPGLHPMIPGEELDFAFDFLVSHIEGRSERRIVNPLAE